MQRRRRVFGEKVHGVLSRVERELRGIKSNVKKRVAQKESKGLAGEIKRVNQNVRNQIGLKGRRMWRVKSAFMEIKAQRKW